MDAQSLAEVQSRSCVLVGEGNLLIECGELLRSGGLFIAGVLSDDPSVAQWAWSIGAETQRHSDHTLSWVVSLAPDYLFSIFNLVILPLAVINAPRIASINYHDAILPRYAGLHATAWAIYHQEQTHGITWHLMEAGIDTGGILGQAAIDIAPADSALSLNLKCFSAALAVLDELLPNLRDGVLRSAPQDLSQRTYVPGSQRPPGGGRLNWDHPAVQLDALVRSCDFGPYRNPIAVPKVWLGSDCMLVSKSAVWPGEAERQAGTLLGITEETLTISTASGSLELGGLMSADGEPLTGSQAAQRYRVGIGSRLSALEFQQEQDITGTAESLYRFERYWEARLEDLVPATPLRSARRTAPGKGNAPVLRQWSIPAAVDHWINRHDQLWTTEVFLLAACGAFLARLSFADTFDVELQYQDSASGHPEVFAAAVPFRFQVDADFSRLLVAVHTELESAKHHRTYPRDLVPRSPRLRGQSHLRSHAKLPVAIVLGGSPSSLDGRDVVIGFDAQSGAGSILMSPALHDQLPELTDMFIDWVDQLASTDGPSHGCSLVSPAERSRLLGWGTGPDASVGTPACAHELIATQAERAPEAVAVIDGAEELTYDELNRAADALASELRRAGVGPDVGVGICMRRSTAMIVGLLGILKSGGFYVPLDPSLPGTRLRMLIDHADIRTFVTTRADETGLPPGVRVYPEELDWRSRAFTQVEGQCAPRCSPQDAAYVLYTSGSTGEPKGVRIEHRSLTNFVQAAMDGYQLTPDDRVLQFASISFDTSVEEIFPTLASGATLVLRPEDMLGSARSFLAASAQLGITVLDLPTAYWHTVVPHVCTGTAGVWPELRLVIIGGETADPAAVHDWCDAIGDSIDLINTYGPTEATVIATWAKLTPEIFISGGVPIGSPLPGVSVEVVDRFGMPVPEGVTGELVIGGAGVASGYVHRLGFTDEKFGHRADPAGRARRTFRTGDLCFWRPDGMLEFVGRIDDQVKVRGFRIELHEIELMLQGLEEVSQAAVVACEHDRPGAEVVLRACIVARSNAEGLNVSRLRAAVREKLPEWMIPSEWIVLDQLPVSVNGKVHRRALASRVPPGRRMPATARPETSEDSATVLERKVLDIWRTVFGKDSVGLDDDFFDLGGDSLLAVCCVEEVEQSLGQALPINALFEYPTVRTLSRALTDQSWIPAKTSLVPLHSAGARTPLFLVHGWGGQLFAYRDFVLHLEADQPVYGLRAATAPDGTPLHATIDDMVTQYVKEIRELQTTGPYVVCGYSVGGWFAFAVAARLRAEQAPVTLVLLDTYPRGCPPPRARRARLSMKLFNWSIRLSWHADQLQVLPTGAKVAHVLHRPQGLLKRTFVHQRPTARPPRAAMDVARDHVEQNPASESVLGDFFADLAAAYPITPIDCPVDLIVSRERGILLQAMLMFWRQLATGDLRVHQLTGNHLAMLGDQRLSRLVGRILDERLGDFPNVP